MYKKLAKQNANMRDHKMLKRIALIGGGPSSMFMLKRLLESGQTDFELDIFEKGSVLGAGMPYSEVGSNIEHVTNVSDNEIPKIVNSIHEWIYEAPKDLLAKFNISPENFNEYKVLPRLFFGEYLSAQFQKLLNQAANAGIQVQVHFQQQVTDIIDHPESDEVWIETSNEILKKFDSCVICTGHNWPKKNEDVVSGYFDSPYPPSKLLSIKDHPVAIRGSSLTAVDAIRTLSRNNGTFEDNENGIPTYKVNPGSNFKIVLHSRSGLLPAVRFHLEDSHLSSHSVLTPEVVLENMHANNGFLSLDFVFEKAFKDAFREHDPEFYERVKDQSLEEFVASMMELRERLNPFTLLMAEYKEAEKSIRRHKSIYWKEMLAILSFAMNYPAKHFSAEDMLRLQKSLSHLITIVIAFLPQTSCKELLALHAAGLLDIVSVGSDSQVHIQQNGGVRYEFTSDENKKESQYYETFIDATGQPHLNIEEFPFKSLVKSKSVTQARLKFKEPKQVENGLMPQNKDLETENDGSTYLKVPGIAINDNFQIIDQYGAYNKRIYMMAVPYMSGFNPDYSGLDFCEAASDCISKVIFDT